MLCSFVSSYQPSLLMEYEHIFYIEPKELGLHIL